MNVNIYTCFKLFYPHIYLKVDFNFLQMEHHIQRCSTQLTINIEEAVRKGEKIEVKRSVFCPVVTLQETFLREGVVVFQPEAKGFL